MNPEGIGCGELASQLLQEPQIRTARDMQKFERLPADILSRLTNVVFAYLFGGLASGSLRPLSDVDLAVFVRKTANLGE